MTRPPKVCLLVALAWASDYAIRLAVLQIWLAHPVLAAAVRLGWDATLVLALARLSPHPASRRDRLLGLTFWTLTCGVLGALGFALVHLAHSDSSSKWLRYAAVAADLPVRCLVALLGRRQVPQAPPIVVPRALYAGALAAILLLAALRCWPTLGSGFLSIWPDDAENVRVAAAVSHGQWLASFAPDAFARFCPGAAGGQTSWYRPVQLLTFALDHHFRGPSPWHWHFTSLLLHLACIVCLAGVVSVLAGDPLAGLIAAAAYAALGSGPDAVGWVSARGDILCGLFLAVAVWSLAIYLRGGRGLWLLPAAAALLLALGSKEIALVAMAALLPVPWLASGKSRGSRIVAALVILGLAGAFLAWRAATFPSLRPAGDNFVGWQGWRSVRLYLEALWPTLTTILASVQTRALTFNAGPILLGILLVGLARARWRPAAFWLGWRALTAAPAVLFAATGLFRQYVPDLAGAAFLGVALSAGCGMAWRHAGTVPWGISRRPPLKRTPHRWRPNWSRIRLKHRASGAGGG